MKLINISKSFISSNGKKTQVFKDFNLNVREHDITCIMGASGVGKSTLLNIIAGLIKPDSGYIEDGFEKISYLFQEPRLFGWKTVLDNVAMVSNVPTALKFLESVGLLDFSNRYPDELSGGQRQRIAIARALAFDAPLILLDEPFQNLDEKTRKELTRKMVDFCRESGKTVVWITHDSDEAKSISNNTIVL